MIKTDIDIDAIIDKLLDVKNCKAGKQVNLSEKEITAICNKSKDIFLEQPILLQLEAPINIAGKTIELNAQM
jgi:hypothetical protein